MFIDEDELSHRLTTDQNLVNQINSRRNSTNIPPNVEIPESEPRPLYEIDRCGSGRTPGSFNRNPLEREAIGTLGHLHGITQASKETGASPSQVHSYMGGYNTTGRRAHDLSLESAVKKNVGKIRDAAIERMLSSMNMITDEKLGQIKKAETLANIAATLGKVAQLGMPKESNSGNNGNQVQIVVYAPAIKGEERYETVDVNLA
jgi:hypothetical protein